MDGIEEILSEQEREYGCDEAGARQSHTIDGTRVQSLRRDEAAKVHLQRIEINLTGLGCRGGCGDLPLPARGHGVLAIGEVDIERVCGSCRDRVIPLVVVLCDEVTLTDDLHLDAPLGIRFGRRICLGRNSPLFTAIIVSAICLFVGPVVIAIRRATSSRSSFATTVGRVRETLRAIILALSQCTIAESIDHYIGSSCTGGLNQRLECLCVSCSVIRCTISHIASYESHKETIESDKVIIDDSCTGTFIEFVNWV